MRTLFILLLLTSCAKHAVESDPQRGVQPSVAKERLNLDGLRESARETLDANCAECHTRGLPTALPRALRIFDLTEPDWSRRMSAARLREAARRLNEPFAPTLGEGEVRPIRASEEARGRFSSFVDAELRRRNDRADDSGIDATLDR